uniref:Thyroid transcription factor 1-associated protein 26 n=1 Tax=Anopheles epiroticus TaxID=199890 RepID=A0A182PQX2_9DIPT
MKTDNKSHSHRPKGGAPVGQRNRNGGGHGKRKNKFFLDAPKPEKKQYQPQHQRSGGDDGGKRGLGVQKTVAFKSKHQEQRQGKRSNNNKYNKNAGRPQTNKPNGRKGAPGAPKPAPIEHRFDSKPEKINFCLAPDRLEAQARAIKQFERLERQQELEQKKQDRQQKHKMMTQKTRKGQPVMQGRMELLFERVKKVVGVQ